MRIWNVDAVMLVGSMVFSGWMVGTQLQAGTEGTAKQAGQDTFSKPDRVVGELYDLVTFPAGKTPDWEQVKSLFIEEAVIVLRTGVDRTSIFTVDTFVQDFMSFIERSRVEETGFEERILRMDSTIYGDIATVLVLYQASFPGRPRPPQQGIDVFQLIRSKDGWKIVAITNERVTPDRSLPEELQE
ncbi:MAG TPA: hypothetical protein VMY18_05255 [Acidobacteriota bacterium]|nr:hypothetical protein [Acidobacteriota bacterium]